MKCLAKTVSWKDLPSGAEALICFVILSTAEAVPLQNGSLLQAAKVTTLSGSMLHIYNAGRW